MECLDEASHRRLTDGSNKVARRDSSPKCPCFGPRVRLLSKCGTLVYI